MKNKGNLNNHIGLPLSLMQLRERPDVAVMELGMNHAGEISALLSIAEPDVRVWTNVGDAHLGFFVSVEAIADAKAEILERASPGTLLVCNADDPRIMSRITGFPGVCSPSANRAARTSSPANIADRALSGCAPTSQRRLVRSRSRRRCSAAAISRTSWRRRPCRRCGRDARCDCRAAARLCGPQRVVARCIGSATAFTLVDDSYNSIPAAIGARSTSSRALTAARLRCSEMLELGDHAARLHDEIGTRRRLPAQPALRHRGISRPRDCRRRRCGRAVVRERSLCLEQRGGGAGRCLGPASWDVLLVKGSRGVRTDVIADRIMAELG